jgi:hypothetical protein
MTGISIPGYLNHVYALKDFLKNYEMWRVWFFRPLTAPREQWDEPFGLHVTKPWNITKEKELLETTMGEIVTCYTKHGGARFMSGQTIPRWVDDQLQKNSLMVDFSDLEYLFIGRPHYYPKLKDKQTLDRIECILIHPIHFPQYGEHLKFWLDFFTKRDAAIKKQHQADEMEADGKGALRNHNSRL